MKSKGISVVQEKVCFMSCDVQVTLLNDFVVSMRKIRNVYTDICVLLLIIDLYSIFEVLSAMILLITAMSFVVCLLMFERLYDCEVNFKFQE